MEQFELGAVWSRMELLSLGMTVCSLCIRAFWSSPTHHVLPLCRCKTLWSGQWNRTLRLCQSGPGKPLERCLRTCWPIPETGPNALGLKSVVHDGFTSPCNLVVLFGKKSFLPP